MGAPPGQGRVPGIEIRRYGRGGVRGLPLFVKARLRPGAFVGDGAAPASDARQVVLFRIGRMKA